MFCFYLHWRYFVELALVNFLWCFLLLLTIKILKNSPTWNTFSLSLSLTHTIDILSCQLIILFALFREKKKQYKRRKIYRTGNFLLAEFIEFSHETIRCIEFFGAPHFVYSYQIILLSWFKKETYLSKRSMYICASSSLAFWLKNQLFI